MTWKLFLTRNVILHVPCHSCFAHLFTEEGTVFRLALKLGRSHDLPKRSERFMDLSLPYLFALGSFATFHWIIRYPVFFAPFRP